MDECGDHANTLASLELLRIIAHGYRLDWSDFDGRSAKAELNRVADLIQREANGEDVAAEVAAEIANERENQERGGW